MTQENTGSLDNISSDAMSQPAGGAGRDTQAAAGTGGDKSEGVNPGQIRKATTQSILKAAQNATGMEFGSVEEMMAALARLSVANQSSTAQSVAQAAADEAQEAQTSKRITGNDLQEQILAMKQEMELKEQRLREKELDSSIRNAMGDRFDGDLTEYTIDKIKNQLVEEDGQYIVVNAKNQQRYNQDGNPMTLRDLIDEIGRTNPKLLRQAPASGGSGLRPQSGAYGDGLPGDGEFVPDYTRDPAAFNAWAQKRGLGKNTGLKGVTASVYNSTSSRKVF